MSDATDSPASPERLPDSSYGVLVVIALNEPYSAYDVKQQLDQMGREFWSVPHTQVYRECARLEAAGLLEADQERGGRRRRAYSLTPAGWSHVRAWVRSPDARSMEIRDVAQLKLTASELSTSEDVCELARGQVAEYDARLARLDRTAEIFAAHPDRRLRALSIAMGRAVYGAARDFWAEIEANPPAVEPR